MATAPTAVVLEEVTKHFRLRHSRSLKENLVWIAQRRTRHEEFTALGGVDLRIRKGETVALLGLNGSGKSTLLKLVAGVMTPDAGKVLVRGKVAGLLEVGAGLHPDLTGRENIFLNASILGMAPGEVEERFDDIVAFADVGRFLDLQVRFYSSGMFLRLAFAVAVHTEPDVFLVDEILAVGDEPFQRKCLARIEALREQGRTLVIVSHDLDLVERLCDRGVVLAGGHVVQDGSVTQAVAAMSALG
jgi:ABC-2 type transport system ATP-binding protein